MRLLDIPLGARGAFPGIRYPQQTEGVRGPGTHIWGVNGQRSMRDTMRDVEAATGAPDGLLLVMHHREIGRIDPAFIGGPKTSSARGPFQFTGPTWRSFTAGNLLARYGFPALSREGSDDLRMDARAAGAMTAEYARFHYGILRAAGVEQISAADLYLMHHGGPDAIRLLIDLYNNRPAATAEWYYRNSGNAIGGHIGDFYVDGEHRQRPRTPREYVDWMTGQTIGSPHRRDYYGRGKEGISQAPVTFRPRADGTDDAIIERPGIYNLPPPNRPPDAMLTPEARARYRQMDAR